MSTALALSRFGQDAAALLLWGASAYLGVLVPRPLAEVLAQRLRRGSVVVVLIALASTVVRLPAEAAGIGQGWGDLLTPGFLESVLADTAVGQAWTVQAIGASLLVPALLATSRAGLLPMAVAAAVLLVGLCLTGHAAGHEGWRGALDRGNAILHVVSSGAWMGALVPVLMVLGRREGASRSDAAIALRRFSQAGHVAVALVLLSGAASTALVLGHWPSDLASPYQALLDAKIALVLAMSALALANRYLVVPAIARTPDASRWLRAGTLAEIVLGLAAVALVAVFGLMDPG